MQKKITEEIREYDFAVRYGGEEFCIILPSASLEEAKTVAQRLQNRFNTETFDVSKGTETYPPVSITASIGLAEFKHNYTEEEFYNNADKALYGAKQGGRNKIVIFDK